MSSADDSGEDGRSESADRPSDSASGRGGDAAVSSDGPRSFLDRLPFADDRVVQALLGIVLVGLALRLLFLGDRVAHFDEGRVAYWVTYTMDTGSFAYRRIIHGPLLQHLDRYVFTLLGANDFTMRLPVALIGATLPLSALLFREHLRRSEVIAMGAFLAFNPVLLYYSRFMRSDLLVAAFMFVAMGLVVRLYDTRKLRYLYLASAAVALGFGAKENAIVYVAVWIGGTVVLADQALYRPREYDSGGSLLWAKLKALWSERLRPWLGSVRTLAGAGAHAGDDGADADDGVERDSVDEPPAERPDGGDPPERDETDDAFWDALSPLRFAWYGLVAVVVFVAISVFIYAPRGAGMEGLYHPPVPPSEGAVGLWQAVGNPVLLPDLVVSTADHTITEFVEWFGSASDPGCNKDNVIDGWLCYLGRFVEVLGTKAAPLMAFAGIGFLYERYWSSTSRNLVMFMTAAGAVSVFGYPLGTDVWGAWLTVHALVPFSVPAAVGLGLVFRWGYEAFAEDDQVGVTIAAVLVLLIAAVSGAVIVNSVYLNDQSEHNNLVQFAQPGGDAQPALQAMAEISEETEGTDVLVYHGETGNDYDSGRAWVQPNEGDFNRSGMAFYPMCTQFHNTLPLPWYVAKDDVEVTCERDEADLRQRLNGDPPPIVITQGYDTTVPRMHLDDEYVERSYEWRTYTRDTSFWIHEDYADALPDR